MQFEKDAIFCLAILQVPSKVESINAYVNFLDFVNLLDDKEKEKLEKKRSKNRDHDQKSNDHLKRIGNEIIHSLQSSGHDPVFCYLEEDELIGLGMAGGKEAWGDYLLHNMIVNGVNTNIRSFISGVRKDYEEKDLGLSSWSEFGDYYRGLCSWGGFL